MLERLHAYLLQIHNDLLPKSEAGQAVGYALKNWTALTRYTENPNLSIDNNHTERALRCFAVGRANWTFFGSDRGGRTAAVLRSFVTSCELVKIDRSRGFTMCFRASPSIPLPSSTNFCRIAGLPLTHRFLLRMAARE